MKNLLNQDGSDALEPGTSDKGSKTGGSSSDDTTSNAGDGDGNGDSAGVVNERDSLNEAVRVKGIEVVDVESGSDSGGGGIFKERSLFVGSEGPMTPEFSVFYLY